MCSRRRVSQTSRGPRAQEGILDIDQVNDTQDFNAIHAFVMPNNSRARRSGPWQSNLSLIATGLTKPEPLVWLTKWLLPDAHSAGMTAAVVFSPSKHPKSILDGGDGPGRGTSLRQTIKHPMTHARRSHKLAALNILESGDQGPCYPPDDRMPSHSIELAVRGSGGHPDVVNMKLELAEYAKKASISTLHAQHAENYRYHPNPSPRAIQMLQCSAAQYNELNEHTTTPARHHASSACLEMSHIPARGECSPGDVRNAETPCRYTGQASVVAGKA